MEFNIFGYRHIPPPFQKVYVLYTHENLDMIGRPLKEVKCTYIQAVLFEINCELLALECIYCNERYVQEICELSIIEEY